MLPPDATATQLAEERSEMAEADRENIIPVGVNWKSNDLREYVPVRQHGGQNDCRCSTDPFEGI